MKFSTFNPFTGKLLEDFETFTDDQLITALERATQSGRQWRQRTLEERGQLFLKMGAMLRNRTEALAEMITREMGKPLREARAEITKCAWACEYYAQNAAKFLAPETVNSDATKSYVRYDPLGTVLAIMPWNFPFWQVFRCAAPALMAGNVVLLKHAPNTTRCALLIEDLFRSANFPVGAFQTLLADNEQVRHMIGSHYVQAVALTGSERAGIAVASAAGASIKKCVLELGGSDPFIVLPDADLNEAAKVAVQARMTNSGQSCIAAKRFIVAEAVAERFLTLVKAAAEKLVLGDPEDPNTEIGPLARPDLLEKLEAQVQRSVKKGAQVLLGGYAEGPFYRPTILTDVRPGMPAFDEELFGPVMAVCTFQTEEEALQLANDTEFGLGASVWTSDTAKAERLAAQLESGAVFVNALVRSDPRLPFGGIKKSGYGRELSQHGIREFTNIKTVFVG